MSASVAARDAAQQSITTNNFALSHCMKLLLIRIHRVCSTCICRTIVVVAAVRYIITPLSKPRLQPRGLMSMLFLKRCFIDLNVCIDVRIMNSKAAI
jgi:hypothetical protein